MWIPEIKLMLSGLAAGAFICGTILLALASHVKKKKITFYFQLIDYPYKK